MNKAVLSGRLAADPELRHTNGDIAVTSFTIAVKRRFAKSGEERQVDFIDVVAWRQTAELVCKYFKKGKPIEVSGSIQTGSYQDKDGNKRKTFEIVADDVSFTESDGLNSASSAAKSETETTQAAYSSGNDSDFQTIESDDDLPF